MNTSIRIFTKIVIFNLYVVAAFSADSRNSDVQLIEQILGNYLKRNNLLESAIRPTQLDRKDHSDHQAGLTKITEEEIEKIAGPLPSSLT